MPFSGPSPLTLQFTDTSSSMATAWFWTFGDGTTSTSQSPTHSFTTEGVFAVTLTVTTPLGVAKGSDTVTVDDDLPVGSFTAPVDVWTAIPGTDPQVMLRFSNDGGKTWINQPQRSAGKIGEYTKRIRWNRLGCARRRVFEVSVTDPIPWKLVGAYLTAMGTGTGQQ